MPGGLGANLDPFGALSPDDPRSKTILDPERDGRGKVINPDVFQQQQLEGKGEQMAFGPDSNAQTARGEPSQSLFDLLKSMVTAQAAEQAKGPPANAKFTFYAPGAGGAMEGPKSTSKVGPDGRTSKEKGGVPSTLDDFRLGKSQYVTLASDPSNYGKTFSLPDVKYTSPIDGKEYTVSGAKGVVHDTGPAFKGRPDKFDIAVGDFTGKGRGASDFVAKTAKVVDPEVAQVGKQAAQTVQQQAKAAEATATMPSRGDPNYKEASLAYTKAFNEAVLSGKGVEESHAAALEAAGKAVAEGKVTAKAPSLPPGATQFPGSENTFGKNSATRDAQPYQAIVTHVTGHQTIGKQGAWEVSNKRGEGYHYFIDRDGTVTQVGNPDSSRSHHMQSERGRTDRFDLTNKNTIGIGFIGGGANPTPAQMAAAKGLVEFLQGKYGIGKDQVFGHGELQGKDAERGPGGLYGAKGEGYVAASFLRGETPAHAPTDVAPSLPPGYAPFLGGGTPPATAPDVGRPTPAPALPGNPGVPTPPVGQPGTPAAPVAPPASAPLGWTSSPGDRGKDAVTTPEASRTGTTNPALAGPSKGTTDRGVQTQYAKGITEAALKGVGPNTSKDEAIARGKAAQAEMARAGVPASVARPALMALGVQMATLMGYGPGSLSWSTGMVESSINSGVNSGMQSYQGAPPGPVQGPPSPAAAPAAPAPAIEAAPAAPVPAAPAPAAPALEAAISLAQQLGLDDITSSPSLGPNNLSALDPAPGMVDPSNVNSPGLPSIDPGGLEHAVPGLFGPVEAAPIDLPTITNEETAPVDNEGPFQSPLTSENESPLTSENEAPGLFAALSGEQGDSLEGFVRLLADGLSMQAGMPADEAMQMILAAAHRLIEEQGLSTERALQVVAQSMQTQMAA
jgi:hypothetical protein